jgi:hypothetical protein
MGNYMTLKPPNREKLDRRHPALIRVAEVLFDATDKDGNGTIYAHEYRTLFRTAFHRDLTTTDGTYGRSAFVGDFLSFMSGRRPSSPYDPLLAAPDELEHGDGSGERVCAIEYPPECGSAVRT